MTEPTVVALDDIHASDPALTGAKAANLARAGAARLPVLPGFVLTTTGGPARDARDAWRSLGGERGVPLVVRSSSTVEDASASSMAGQFTSVLDVRGWEAFADAVATVRASARATGAMGVLVQPQLDSRCGGVLFGLDPVTGDARNLAVEVVDGAPDALVSGRVTAEHLVLSRRGRVLEATAPVLDRRRRRALARMAARAASAFGGPQDIEWAFGRDGRLWLLQARPITACAARPSPDAPMLGPGPVAETFPDPLHPLEVELWLEPLTEGLAGALALAGAASYRAIRRSPVVVAVDGRVAADLVLLGVRRPGRARRLFAPGRWRRLATSWRVGRLRVALPGVCDALVRRVDDGLADIPPVRELDDAALLDLLDRTRAQLVAVHGHEVLAGMLLADPPGAVSLPAVALGAVTTGAPEWLALVPPRIGTRHPRPVTDGRVAATGPLSARDALRLRIRWLQELGAVAANELGRRTGLGADIRDLTLADLRAGPPFTPRAATVDPTPLPAEFRLAADGTPVAVDGDRRRAAGLAAGGGRGAGPVHHGDLDDPPEPHDVLVVRTLDPRLAPVLPGLAGLVAETGSALSHLAILARELGVPTVVGVPHALDRYPEGATVVVDGSTGEVSAREEVR